MKRGIGIVLVAMTVVFVALALWLFPQALPTIALKQDLTADSATTLARDFVAAHQLPVDSARVAVQFSQDGETQTFIELEAGGKPAVNSEVNQGDVALFSWSVRFFRFDDPREVRVTLTPTGRILGFRRTLADVDARPVLDSAAAFLRADSVRTTWLGLGAQSWKPVAMSVETVQPSGRLDRTFTWERTDRTLGGAPLRLDVVVRGDVAGGARQYVKIPEPFLRRYAERRADNDLYALIASLFAPVFAVLGIGVLVGARKQGLVRWRPALIAGGVIGGALTLAQLNGIPGNYFFVDTALSPGTFLAQNLLMAIAGGVALVFVSAVLIATGELLTRLAFPHHVDWWKTLTYAGTRPVALRVLSGYTLAAFGLAYVAVFYLVVEKNLGWWSPSSLLDDPNLIATPFPWLSAVATSLQAGVLEEILFRAIPIALVARMSANRPWRPYALGAAVLLTALVFGFAHANYPSFPAYARGVELFAEAVLWALIYLRFGLITTIVGHFTYDLTLFGLFAAAGSAPPYRISLAVVVLIAALPALMVAVKAWRARGLIDDIPDDARFAAWTPTHQYVTDEMPVQRTTPGVSVNRGTVMLAAAAVVLGLWVTVKPASPRFTATRPQAIAVADSLLVTLGSAPDGWTRLVASSTQSWGNVDRFLKEEDSTGLLREKLSRVWLHSGQWDIRYVHTSGSVSERTESWHIQLAPDGTPHTWQHTIADSAPAPAVSRSDAEAAARGALRAAGMGSGSLPLLSAKETARPARQDVEFEFADSSMAMPAASSLRLTATVSGDRVTKIGHRVFLSESWERQNAKRTTTLSIWAAVAGISLLVLGIFGVWRFMKRPALLPAFPWPSRGKMIGVVALAGVILMFSGANSWPSKMYGWDTTIPFNRHQWTSALGLLAAALGPVVVWGLWLAVDAMRRRMGVPLRSASARDAWLVGGALTVGMAVERVLPGLVFPRSWMALGTGMDSVVPALASALDGISGAMFDVPLYVFVSAAALSIVNRSWRIAGLAIVTVVTGVIFGASDALSNASLAAHVFVHAIGYGAIILVFWKFGQSSVEAWFIAALIVNITSQLRSAYLAASSADQISHLLGALCAIAFGLYVTARPKPSPLRAP